MKMQRKTLEKILWGIITVSVVAMVILVVIMNWPKPTTSNSQEVDEQWSPNTVGDAPEEITIGGIKVKSIPNTDDTDGDGILDIYDDDIDGDGIINTQDEYPLHANNARAREAEAFIRDITAQVSTRKITIEDGQSQLASRMYESNENYIQYAMGQYALEYTYGDMRRALEKNLLPLLNRKLTTNERYQVIASAASAYEYLGEYGKAKEMAIEAVRLNPTNFIKPSNDYWIKFYDRMSDLEGNK
jgi:predicted nucleotidyltransferase